MPRAPIDFRYVVLPALFVPFISLALAGDPKIEAYRGQVVPLAGPLKKLGVELDADAGPSWLALQLDNGKLFPLVKDAGSRMFFHDPKLLKRPMEIQGRIVPGTGLLQITHVSSLKDGMLHDVYYWCDVCSIKRFSLEKTGVCECCGGPMELKEVPVKK